MADNAGAPALFRVLWETKLWRGLLLLFVYSFGFATLVPGLPTIFTNFFAERYAGHPIDCQQYGPKDAPAACQNAHSDAVQWSSWTSFASNSILTFFFSPMVGDLSDRLGRKPFIVAGFALSLLPTGVVVAYLYGHASLLWYYPMNALSGVVSSVVVFLAYTADVVGPRQRTAGFGMIIAAFSLGFMVGPILGGQLEPRQAVWVTVGCSLATILGALLFIPESLPQDAAAAGAGRQQARSSSGRPKPLDVCLSLRKCLALLGRTSLFRKLALCMAIVGVVSEGIQDMLIQYLQLTAGFTTADQGMLFVVLGACNLAVQGFALAWLAPALGEQRLLVAGLLLYCVEQAMLATVASKGAALAAVAVGSMAGVSWPAISAIKSNNSAADEQGLVQGALAGIRALAQGLGPLVFAQLFAAVTRTDSPLGYHPGAVFWVSCVLTAIAAAVAATIDRGAGKGGGGGGLPTVATSDEVAGFVGSGAAKHDAADELGPAAGALSPSGDDGTGGGSSEGGAGERRPLLAPRSGSPSDMSRS